MPSNSMLLSIVIPTRDRNALLLANLDYLNLQGNKQFEVIILENPSTEGPTLNLNQSNYNFPIKHSPAKRPLSMTENWNRWTDVCSGEYICFLSDRFFLVPGAVNVVIESIFDYSLDVYNMHYTAFYPADDSESLAVGGYFIDNRLKDRSVELYNTHDWLDYVFSWEFPHLDLPPWLQKRGMIYGGIIKRSLLDVIERKAGAVFHGFAPDYSSMPLILQSSRTLGGTIMNPLFVAPNYVNLSNGSCCASDTRRLSDFIGQYSESVATEVLKLVPIDNLFSVYNLLFGDLEHSRRKGGIEARQSAVNAISVIICSARRDSNISPSSLDSIDSYARHLAESDLSCIEERILRLNERIDYESSLRRDRINGYSKVYVKDLSECLGRLRM